MVIMSSTDILLENMANQIAELREIVIKHLEKEDTTKLAKIIDAFKGWIVPIACAVTVVMSYEKPQTKQPLEIPSLKAVASSTFVASKRAEAITKEIEDKIK